MSVSARWIVSALILALCAANGVAQEKSEKKVTKKQAQAALKEFDKYYSNKNEHVRKAAVDQIGETNHADCVKPLLMAATDESGEVRSRVIPALAKLSDKAALAELTRQLKKTGKLEIQLAILEAFKTTQPKVAYETIVKLARSKKFELRLVAMELLAVMPSDRGRSEALLMEATKDSSSQIRLVAIDALVKLKHPAAVDTCLQLMVDDPEWNVRATCMAALRAYRQKRTIEPLIDAMEREKGRLRDDAHAALQDITGFDYSAKVETWRRWWNRVKARFQPPTEEEKKAAAKQLKAARAAYDRDDRDYTPFTGIKTKSRRMMFVLDVSYSMRDKLSFATTDETRVKEFRERYGEYETKIDLAREELIDTVAGLPPHVKFNIVLFNSGVTKWKPKIVKASAGSRNQAIKWLSKPTPQWISDVTAKQNQGQTNTFAAINLALGLKNEPQKKPSKNHKVESDTVFFLTDGMPTVGRIIQPDELIRYFKVVNRRAKIVFHTITFGRGNEALLIPLARESGGKYHVISVD